MGREVRPRFFHALVVVGAAISAAACGGKSEGTSGDDTAGNGGGGTGGSLGGTGGTGGDIVLGGMGGTQPTGSFPEPGPTAQWDCSGNVPSEPGVPLADGCFNVLGRTAASLTDDCPVDPTFPKSAAECTSDEIFTCILAVAVDGVPVLVNCTCETLFEGTNTCSYCTSLSRHYGPPASCTPELKICECAYTGILR
jgi:hypothetical protein